MIKLKWVALLGLGLVAMQATAAERPIVIDNQTIGEQPAATKSGASATVQPDAQPQSQAEANEANKERVLKGGKLSPREKAAVGKAAAAETNQTEGVSFLAANKAKKGVVTLPSGLQYKILRAGKGKKPTEASTVMCRYKGTLTDGTSVDKTDDKKPSALRVAGFLPGLKEAVTLMSPGSKWEVVVPPQLAYGSQGNRGIGPNAVLVYQIEILGIK
jgi:FKBP-type peptidyl-prolyl cis-trans isomerase